MSEENVIKHYFYNPTTKSVYIEFITKEVLQKIKTDKEYAKKVYEEVVKNRKEKSLLIKKEEENSDIKEPKEPYFESSPTSSTSNEISFKKENYFVWNHKATKLLIYSYGSHIDELQHPIKRKHFWDNIVNDLTSNAYDVTKTLCVSKWNNLLKTYKLCKDKTGREPMKFNFFDEMDEILGDKPSNSSNYTISSLKRKQDLLNKENINSENKNLNNNSKFEKIDKETDIDNLKKFQKVNNEKKLEKKRKEDKYDLMRKRLEMDKEKLNMENRKCELIEKYLEYKNNLK